MSERRPDSQMSFDPMFIVGNDKFAQLARAILELKNENEISPSSSDLDFLRTIDTEIVGDLGALDEMIKQLELKAIGLKKTGSFLVEPSFAVDGFGRPEDVEVVEAEKRDEMLAEHQNRLALFKSLMEVRMIDGGMRIVDGGLKSSESTHRRADQARAGVRVGYVPDYSRFRVICDGLKDLDKNFEPIVDTLCANGFDYVGCRNKYYLGGGIAPLDGQRERSVDQQGEKVEDFDYTPERWRCISTVWSRKSGDEQLDRVPTEIQFVTSAMNRMAGLRHPFREFSRSIEFKEAVGRNQAKEAKEWLEKLTAKTAIHDWQQFLDRKK